MGKNRASKAVRQLPGPFPCPYCFLDFKFIAGASNHADDVHKDEALVCYCGKSFINNEALTKHFFAEHILQFKDQKCRICQFFLGGDAEMFLEHMRKYHLRSKGLTGLVEDNEEDIFEVKLKEMKSTLTTQIAEETDVSEVIETVKHHVKDAKLPDIQIVRILWDVIMDAVQWSGKNQQQNANAALRQVKTWAGLLNTFCTSGKLELELMYKVQIQCYKDAKLKKLFAEIVRSLYDQDVLAEDTILLWFRKGNNSKGRQIFVKALEPFVNWLEEE